MSEYLLHRCCYSSYSCQRTIRFKRDCNYDCSIEIEFLIHMQIFATYIIIIYNNLIIDILALRILNEQIYCL